METLVAQIRERYENALDKIAAAAQASGRDPESVRLVVVTKAQPLEVVQATFQAGVRLFGENYPEESVTKISSFGPESGVEWHMIGHVQSRKARLVIEHFDLARFHCASLWLVTFERKWHENKYKLIASDCNKYLH